MNASEMQNTSNPGQGSHQGGPHNAPEAQLVNLTMKNEQIKTFEARIRKIQQTGTIPIIDVEFHYRQEQMDVGTIIDTMDRNGVALTWLGPMDLKNWSEIALRLNKLYPDHFVPITAHGHTHWNNSNSNFLNDLDKKVRSGKFFAMGEFNARHYPADPSQVPGGDSYVPVDSQAFEILFNVSSDTGVPFLLHHEAEDRMLPELERMLTKYPNAKVVWCHFGRDRNPGTWTKFMTPDGPREFLNKYPNLYFDLDQANPGGNYFMTGYVDAIMYDTTQSPPILKPEWKQLIEDYPDHFVIGSDASDLRIVNYDRVIDTMRNSILSEMPKDIAEKIAYKNAWKLMTGEDWTD